MKHILSISAASLALALLGGCGPDEAVRQAASNIGSAAGTYGKGLSPESILTEGENAVANGDFREWAGSSPARWRPVAARVKQINLPTGEPAAEFVSATPGKDASLVQTLEGPPSLYGHKVHVLLRAWSIDPGKVGMNLYYGNESSRHVLKLQHPGDGQWHDLTGTVNLAGSANDKPVEVLVVNRAGANAPARVAFVKVTPAD